MKTIRKPEDLKPYGIDYLTGEACAYMYRTLCDVTLDGQALIARTLGLNGVHLRRAMNDSWNDSNRSTGSIMLPRQMFEPLAVFALFEVDKCAELIIEPQGIHGLESTDSYEQWEQYCDMLLRQSKPSFVFLRAEFTVTTGQATHDYRIIGERFTGWQHEADQKASDLAAIEKDASSTPNLVNVVAAKVRDGFDLRRMKNPGRSRNTHAMSGRTE